MHAGTWLWLWCALVAVIGGGIWLWGDQRGDYNAVRYPIAGVVGIIGAVGFAVMSIGVGVAAVDTIACQNKGDALGRDSRYSWSADCLVESDDGTFVPIDNLRITSEEQGQ